MQQLDIPIITKTYELYRALHDLQKGIPKMERYSLWSRVEATALQMLEGFVHVGYLPCEQRAQKLTRLAAEVDMLRMFIRLAVDIKVLPSQFCTLVESKKGGYAASHKDATTLAVSAEFSN